MKKSQLKTGMVVETREGKRGLVLLGTPLGDIIGGCGGHHDPYMWGPLSEYSKDLDYGEHNDMYDIVRVYQPGHNRGAGSLDEDYLELLWERQRVALRLNDNYEAIVDLSSDTISVGCQKIPITKLKELLTIIEKREQ